MVLGSGTLLKWARLSEVSVVLLISAPSSGEHTETENHFYQNAMQVSYANVTNSSDLISH